MRSEEFTLAVVSLVLSVKQIMISEDVSQNLKQSIRDDFRKLIKRVKAVQKQMDRAQRKR